MRKSLDSTAQDRSNREFRRRSGVVWVLPSRKLLIRMPSTVLSETDED